jgi:hypothetical protein
VGTLNVVEFVREKKTNVIIGVIGIIQGKTTMDASERLFTAEQGDKIYFWSTDNQNSDVPASAQSLKPAEPSRR